VSKRSLPAVRKNGTLYYLLTDHLGSNSMVADENGDFYSKKLFKLWGEERFATQNVPLPTRSTWAILG